MAVQAQLYSDHYYLNNNMGFSQDWVLMSNSSVFDIGNENKQLSSSPSSSSYQHQQDQSFLMNSASGYHQNLVSSSNSRRNGMIGLQNLSSELERQRLEMDCFLHFQVIFREILFCLCTFTFFQFKVLIFFKWVYCSFCVKNVIT